MTLWGHRRVGAHFTGNDDSSLFDLLYYLHLRTPFISFKFIQLAPNIIRRVRLENEPHDIMDIGEIVLKKKRFQDRGKRCTDLMNPVYAVNGIVVQDESRYSKPKPLKKYIPENLLLQTKDIDGAYSGWGTFKRNEYRNIMTTADVEGAQADTIKHSIISNRLTNPLTPVYQSLEGEPLAPLLMPLLPQSIVKVPTLRPNSNNGKTKGKPETMHFTRENSFVPNAMSESDVASTSYAATKVIDDFSFLVPGKGDR